MMWSFVAMAQKTQIALLKYRGGGDWYSNPTSLPNLVKFCNQNIMTDINVDVATVDVGSPDIFNYPFVHATGHGNIVFDDNEVDNLKKICDETFGEDNFIARLSIIVKTEGRQYGSFAKTHEYSLVYSKSSLSVQLNEIKIVNGEFKYRDKKGGFNTIGLRNRAVRIFNSTNRPNLRYPFYVDIENKDEYGFSKVSTIPHQNPFYELNLDYNKFKSIFAGAVV